jgi:hypothetical protein
LDGDVSKLVALQNHFYVFQKIKNTPTEGPTPIQSFSLNLRHNHWQMWQRAPFGHRHFRPTQNRSSTSAAHQCSHDLRLMHEKWKEIGFVESLTPACNVHIDKI